VLTRSCNAFDRWRYDDMAAMFAPDGGWYRSGKSLKGAAILEALNAGSRTHLLLVVPGTLGRLGDAWKIASMSMNREFEY
jgi:hypothetical protein